MTISEHIELGNIIKANRLVFMRARRTLGETYPKSHKCIAQINKVSREIDELRNVLDGIVCAEHPADPKASHVYYGGYNK